MVISTVYSTLSTMWMDVITWLLQSKVLISEEEAGLRSLLNVPKRTQVRPDPFLFANAISLRARGGRRP